MENYLGIGKLFPECRRPAYVIEVAVRERNGLKIEALASDKAGQLG
jgi:hypothetical protein